MSVAEGGPPVMPRLVTSTPQSTVISFTQATIGGTGSRTLTVKLQVEVKAAPSVAVQVTVFVPVGKVLPVGGVQTKVTGLQLSVAVTVNKTGAEHMPPVPGMFTTMGAGQVIVGGVASWTVKDTTHTVGLLAASLTVTVMG